MRLIFILIVLSLTGNVNSQEWNRPLQLNSSIISFSVISRPLEIFGEINPDEIGVTGVGVGQYGVQGGGYSSALAMLAAHAMAVQGQRNEQLEKLNSDAKLFGSFITNQLDGIYTDKFLFHVLSEMPEGEFINLNSVNSFPNANIYAEIDYKYSLSRDNSGLRLEINFSILNKNILRFILYSNNNDAYSEVNYQSKKSDVKKDINLLMQEAVRLFYFRFNGDLIKKDSSRTFRYLVGKGRRYERGFLIGESCYKFLFENLSETWISAPKSELTTSDENCK